MQNGERVNEGQREDTHVIEKVGRGGEKERQTERESEMTSI